MNSWGQVGGRGCPAQMMAPDCWGPRERERERVPPLPPNSTSAEDSGGRPLWWALGWTWALATAPHGCHHLGPFPSRSYCSCKTMGRKVMLGLKSGRLGAGLLDLRKASPICSLTIQALLPRLFFWGGGSQTGYDFHAYCLMPIPPSPVGETARGVGEDASFQWAKY